MIQLLITTKAEVCRNPAERLFKPRFRRVEHVGNGVSEQEKSTDTVNDDEPRVPERYPSALKFRQSWCARV